MSALELVLGVAAFVAGVTGTWSPCGFSMIETIGPAGHTGGRPTTIAACITFALGALAGALITFASLASLGAVVHGADDGFAYALGAGLALVAALAEARGLPIVPQVRRQLPEHWRRTMPMPLAAGLYGVLLGLGFTTFVLTFGVFALAGISFAVGSVGVGLAIGFGFGVGRSLPVVLAAPLADRPAGLRITELMADRPMLLRGIRIGDALALTAAAAALAITVPASAARVEHKPAADPAVGGDATVFQRPDRSGVLLRGGDLTGLPGHDPALGGGRIAVIQAGQIIVLSAQDLHEVGRVRAGGADAVAVSQSWLAWRARARGRDVIRARKIRDPSRPGPEKALGKAGGAAMLGRPTLDDNRLVYARATRRQNRIVKRVLGVKRRKRAKATLLRSRQVGLSNPSLQGGKLLYVRHTRKGDLLKLAALGRGKGRTLLRRPTGTLWSTALGAKRAYVTQIRGTAPRQKILSVKR